MLALLLFLVPTLIYLNHMRILSVRFEQIENHCLVILAEWPKSAYLTCEIVSSISVAAVVPKAVTE